MKRCLALLFSLLIMTTLACVERQEPPEEEKEIEASGDYETVVAIENLKDFADRKVCITGTVSTEPSQHLMDPPDSLPVATYFDVGGMQTVVYSAKNLACPNCKCTIEIKGTVLKVQGKGKGSKASEDYTEYHLLANSWRCLDEEEEKGGGE